MDPPQVPLNNFANTSSGYELDSLSIPVFCAALSALIFVVHAALVLKPKRATFDAAVTQDERVTVGPRVTETSTTRLIFKILRLCGCLVLLALAVTSAVIGDQNQQEAAAATFKLSAKMLLCLVYFYASILASISISGCSWSTVSERHVNTLLLAILFTYVYRDVYPLATFARPQLDIDEGGLMWAKIVILTIIGVVLPLAVPRSYTPLDAQDSEPAAGEQTASIISLVTYSFLDPLIFLASQLSHLSYDLLPPLPDYNDVKNLKAAAFTHLTAPSEGKLRHVFFSLLWIFRAEYATVLLLSTVQVAASFSSPIAINRLLNDLETKASDADARPWLWIVLLFVGPTVGSVATQWGRFISNRVNVQAEAILTELIFEHALRVRVKAETSDLDFSEGTGPPAAKARNLVGKLNNLATTDLRNIVTAGEELPKLLAYLLQGCLGVCFLYKVLDWAAFVGLGVTVAMFPLPSLVAQQLRSVQQGLMQRTDARVQTVSETMSLLRMIKLFAWEKKTEERISEARSDELNWLWKNNSLQLFVSALNFIIPIFTMMATYATYTMLMKQELSPSLVFSSMTVFDMFREQLHQFFFTMTNLITGRVAVDRLDEFLRESELLDAYSAPSQPTDIGASSLPISANYIIGFNNATFSWSSSDATQRHFLLRIDGSLFFKPNCINLIVGPTGAGKTSLLMALLGEMHFIPSSRDSWFNLGQQKVAYAAQQSWVLPDTIKANIVFGASFDSDRYNKVLYQCGLEPDLEMFVAGDLQEIGEGGLTLSGGQKARITLARAVYSSAAILLLDDVLAALDVHTAQWIVEKCFRGDLLIGRTMLLVTHNIALTQPIAEFVVSMGSDGRILSQGTVSDALAKNHDLALVVHGVKTQTLHEEIADGSLEKRQTKGKLVLAEEVALGHLSWDTLKFYMSAQGGGHPIFYFITLGICMLITDSLVSLQTWYLGHFASQYDDNDVSEVDVPYHLAIYGAILFGTVAVYSFNYLRYIIGMIRASTIIHAELVHSILGTTLRWLDITPTSRVIARCTQDVRDVDVTIGMSLWSVLDLFCLAGIKLGIILIMSPLFVLPAAVLLLAGGWVGNLYRKAQLSVKREMSNARAPVLGHFGAAIDGLISIRAYGAQEAFIDVSLKHINYYTRTARTFQLLGRWVGIRLDTLGTVFTGLLAVYMVYFQDHGSSDVGFSLNMSSGFGLLIMYGVGTINQLEIQSNSIERIKQYLEIEQEPKETVNGRPPAHWPSSGNLRAENLSARYSADGPSVLRDISFDIKGGERIGIVGRTGSGKSSLTLALLRAILTDGLVYYDGIATSSLNLEAVRRNITIIPQIPELLNDSLRMNLDPLGENDDATMNDALRAAGLFSLQEASNGEGTQITLDTLVASGGANLSVGQRQILALARALIRGSKVLVLDEATSAIDYETDKVIQESLRTELGKDVTLLTVAHRLQSIMDADRIMVLDAGNIVEFASPQQLLANPAGKLRALVDESQDKDILLAMASKPAFNRR